MTQPTDEIPLNEWNRLNNENAEQGFVSAMYISMTETSVVVSNFSMWLLAGTGGTCAVLLSQVDSVLPHLSERGFKVCFGLLALSAIFGFIAKYFAVKSEIQANIQTRLNELLAPICQKHEQNEGKILEYAKQDGVALDTNINMENVIKEFLVPFPCWAKLIIAWKMKSFEGQERQAGYRLGVKSCISQANFTFIQSLFFLGFMLAAGYYASAI